MNKLNYQLNKSRLFSQTLGKPSFNLLFILIAYFLLWVFGLFLGRELSRLTLNILDAIINSNDSIKVAVRRIVVCGTQILIFMLWVKKVEKRPSKSIGFQTGRPLRSYSLGFVLGICSITLITAVLVWSGMVKLQHNQLSYSTLIFNIGVLVLGWMIQSASEEIAIRGWLIPRLANRSNPLLSILITAIVFGILHLFSSGVTILSFINLVLSGVFFSGYAIVSENIWGVCGLHFAWNFALGNLYGFPVSGFSANGDSILTVYNRESNWFTGGEFGPEGGLVTAILLLVAISILYVCCKKKFIEKST